MNVLFDSNSKGKAHIKKVDEKPSSLVVVIGEHKYAMVGKAIEANCFHLSKNSYKNIILEIYTISFLRKVNLKRPSENSNF